jgi:light-regulated signal transduction histidine kinase (bacteriophytochrome)
LDIPEEPIETGRGRRWLHTKKVPIKDDAGGPVFLLGISEDITQRKAEALELRRAKDETDAVNRELEAFSYSIAHDLRAPLRSIDGFSLALLEDCGPQLDEEGKEHLKRVRAAAQRMGRLIDDLLSLSRMTRGPLERSSIDLTKLSREVVADLQRSFADRKIACSVHEGLRADGDPGLLRVLLENLIGNAFKFTSRVPSATIEVGKDTDGAFFVRDNGAGFDMAHAGKLFGVFQRLHTTAEFPGTGIGLVSVQRIVQRHGGTIWATGAVDRGATFFFTLTPGKG